METKKEIRQAALQRRSGLTLQERQNYSHRITERVLSHPFFQCAELVCCYLSFRDEVDTTELVQTAWSLGKTVAVPRVFAKNRMEFYKITCWEEIGLGYQGIPEPEVQELRRVDLDPEEQRRALMLLPGVVFDRDGNRIGYGKGFYDRYLQRYPHFQKVGLAFSVQCREKILSEAQDVCVDAILTERGDYKKRSD